MIQLRDYQLEAVDAVLSYWDAGRGHALVEAATGGGKSLILAELMRRLWADFGARVVCATHVAELIEQDCAALQSLWPEAPCGIFSAQLGRRDGQAPLLFASIQSIFRNPEVIGEREVLLIDEAHLLSRKDDGMYGQLIQHMSAKQPSMRIAGASATCFRLDSGKLTEAWRGKPPLFEETVYKIGVLELLDRGLLSPLVPYAPHIALDTSGVKKQGGEFVQRDLEKAVDKDEINAKAIEEVVAAGHDRSGWLIFATGASHCEHLRDLVRGHGVDCEMILGETPKGERAEIVRRFKAKELRCVVAVNTILVGFDAPHVDLIACLRPTESKGLFIQLAGRGLRRAEGKQDCLFLDFARVTQKFGPVDMIDGSKNEGAPGKAPVKECDSCGRICHASAKKCPGCGYEFPALDDIKLSAASVTAPIFSTQQDPVWMDIERIFLRKHIKRNDPGAAPSLRIDYATKFVTVSHWVALEHPQSGGFARRWWSQHSYSGDAPRTVDEAIERIDDLRVPGRILTQRDGKYTRVIHWDYAVPPGKAIPVMRELSNEEMYR